MISLRKGEIDGITVELTVEETIGSKLGGYPTLLVGDVLIESIMINEVDTLAVIKAIATSESVKDFEENLWISDCWNSERIIKTIKAFVYDDELGLNNGGIIAESVHNEKIIDEIETLAKFLDDDEVSPRSKTTIKAKIYDLHKKLELI